MKNKQVFSRYLTVLAASLLIAWSMGASPHNVRIIQTNSAGDTIHIIDHATKNPETVS
jgi:hypothetical protein